MEQKNVDLEPIEGAIDELRLRSRLRPSEHAQHLAEKLHAVHISS